MMAALTIGKAIHSDFIELFVYLLTSYGTERHYLNDT